jgi:hypothetical protein
LNIEDAYLSCESTRIDPRRLFYEYSVSSATLFWRDYNLRIINPDDIIGIRGRASNLGSMASLCAAELAYPKMRVIDGAHWNQEFRNPFLLPLKVEPIGKPGRFTEGWKLIS